MQNERHDGNARPYGNVGKILEASQDDGQLCCTAGVPGLRVYVTF